jgi:N6-adenosine-specific RNA methylase IME4
MDIRKLQRAIVDGLEDVKAQGIVVFKKGTSGAIEKTTNEALNEWNFDVRHMLDKIEQTCHLINREKVVHGE